MKSIVEFFKNRIVISIIGLIVLSLVIWFVGPAIKFGENNYAPLGGEITRLVVIMVIVVLWGLNNLRVQMKDKKNNDELVRDLEVNQSTPTGGVLSDQTAEEVHQIGERFSQAMGLLKKHKFKGFGMRRGLYELPWYIIIGPPGSGKTTALVNSSLDFPLAEQFGKGALRGVGGTRNCDWWFTNEAVLIDTAGRYTTQDSHKVVDSAAWEGFLSLLKKHRRRRPINGAIIAISLQDLLTQSEEERLAHARTIRTRIDELMEKLEIRFPIYMMFTKSDLVSGFSEFFEDMGKEEREQVWGVSLPNAPKALQSPDFEFLETEYRKLMKRLYERVVWRVHDERDIKRRSNIQGFPQQMDNLGKVISHFVQQTFIKNRYRYQPYLRGVYFTSGVQDGTPIDRLMSAVSANFGFDRQLVQTGFQQGKSFFLGQLFKSIIFPESELVGSNRRYEMFIKWTQRAAYVSLAGVTITMFLVWAGSFTRNEMYMREVGKYIAEFNAESKRLSQWSDDMRTVLPALNALAKASVVYDQEAHPWLSTLGMYDGNVDTAADKAYMAQLHKLLLPRLLKYLEADLRQGDQGTDVYNTFRVYLMFNKIKHFNKDTIANWFISSWEKKLQGQADLRNELKIHTQILLSQTPEAVPLSQELIRQVRADLIRIPAPQRIYSSIKSDSRFAQKINLMEELGEPIKNAFVVNDNVVQKMIFPILFTKTGYDSADFSPESDTIAGIAKEKWVLSDDEGAGAIDFGRWDPKDMSGRVKEYYYADYRTQWQSVYDSLEIRSFQNIQQANEVLNVLTDSVRSPIISVLQLGSKNTQLSPQMLASLSDDGKDKKDPKEVSVKDRLLTLAKSQIELTPVDNQFKDVNRLMRESKDKPAAIGDIIQKLKTVQQFVSEIALSPDPGKKSLEIVKARYQGGGNVVISLANDAQNLPQPLKRWLTTISNETWRVMLQSAHGAVGNEWRAQVYEPYTRMLAGRYPLNPSSQNEVAINDFTEFFKPGGIIDKFSAEYVKPFVDARTWGNRGVDNHSIGLSAAAISQLKRANEIKTVFFGENPSMPSVTFQLKPYDMKKSDSRFMLELGDKRLSYSHGPKFWETVTWSGSDQFSRVRLVFEDLNERQHSTTFEGPWAWFHLQETSQLSSTGSSNVYRVTYSVTEGSRIDKDKPAVGGTVHSIQYEIKAKSVVNPFNHDLLRSFKLPEGI